jgi:hypothetical protein
MDRLLLCYISGMDLRRLDAETTPFMAEVLASCPWTPYSNLPSNELFPTLVCGVDPTVHGVWGVRLGAPPVADAPPRLVDRLPDSIVTGVQCVIHALHPPYDLAAIPPRRRRRLVATRTKYKRRRQWKEALYGIGGVPSVMDVVGPERSRYLFSSTSHPARLLSRLCAPHVALEILELYSLDRCQQWNLDRPEQVRRFYGVIDAFLRDLHARCRAAQMRLLVVSDHGHEPIRASLDLTAALAQSGLHEHEYTHFVEVSSVRFWCHSKRAQRELSAALERLGHGRLVRFDEMAQYGVPLKDSSYGEIFYFLDPGYIFFPHDFHHPLANLVLGLVDPLQRSRLRDPRHRGNHGHLPDTEPEQAFVALLDAGFVRADVDAHILDVAPSVLELLARTAPPTMRGRSLFVRR